MVKTATKKARTTRASTKADATPYPTSFSDSLGSQELRSSSSRSGTSVEQTVLSNAELLSNVLHYLKELEAEGNESKSDACHWPGPLEPSRIKNRAFFARLAIVNKAFFCASTDVLWQCMHDLIPFFGHVLQADKDDRGRPCLPMVRVRPPFSLAFVHRH
jgi:hypothetical protein